MHLQNIVFETDFCKLISNNVRRWRGLSGYYGIQYPNNDIKFGSHGSLGWSSASLSCSEFGHGDLETIHTDDGKFGVRH